MSEQRSTIDIQHVDKTYIVGPRRVPALRDVTLAVEPGEYVSIVGPSGCGKSTLLNLLAGIDSADSGVIRIGGTNLGDLNQNDLAAWRGRSVGIVFQFFQLMPTLTALENVMLPMDLAGRKERQSERALTLLERVGLAGTEKSLPSELSGGEQQRVAVARALANAPGLVLADEPTGNLDSANGRAIVEILESLWADGTTVVVVTHDPKLAERSPRIVSMRDGQIISDRRTSSTTASVAAV
ncbi:MAG TPA: ABC transporter ATP-binding protein [Thermomicrobiales bacterium]|nr:ABC transporter ATP-binding protein [Thermomicrobiales bacterium]